MSMTTLDLINYYARLLILQYLGQPKAYAHIQTLVTPVVMDQLPLAVQNAFAIGTAVGVQLDAIGKYAGVTRSGFGINGPITLNDSDFTTLIQVAILKTNAGSSLATIQNLLHTYFPGEILVFDHANMSMDYFIDSGIGSQNLAQLFITENLLPCPMGVQLGALIFAPSVNNFFGFRTYGLPGYNISPFNTYASYQLTYPWLSYSNAVII